MIFSMRAAGIAAPLQARGELAKLIHAAQIHDERQRIGTFAGRAHAGLAARRDLRGEHALVRLQIVDGGRRSVGADAHVVLAADVHRMIDVRHDVRRGRVTRRIQERHEVDADEAAL